MTLELSLIKAKLKGRANEMNDNNDNGGHCGEPPVC